MVQALPHVSVCIPVYNGESSSPKQSEACSTRLAATSNWSCWTTPAATPQAASPGPLTTRVRVEINPATIPQPENWRAAVRLCRAPLIKLLCADDLLHPRCLEFQVARNCARSP